MLYGARLCGQTQMPSARGRYAYSVASSTNLLSEASMSRYPPPTVLRSTWPGLQAWHRCGRLWCYCEESPCMEHNAPQRGAHSSPSPSFASQDKLKNLCPVRGTSSSKEHRSNIMASSLKRTCIFHANIQSCQKLIHGVDYSCRYCMHNSSMSRCNKQRWSMPNSTRHADLSSMTGSAPPVRTPTMRRVSTSMRGEPEDPPCVTPCVHVICKPLCHWF